MQEQRPTFEPEGFKEPDHGNLLILFIVLFFLLMAAVACQYRTKDIKVVMVSDAGTSYTYCDSLTMTSDTSAILWIDGHTTQVYANAILFSNITRKP